MKPDKKESEQGCTMVPAGWEGLVVEVQYRSREPDISAKPKRVEVSGTLTEQTPLGIVHDDDLLMAYSDVVHILKLPADDGTIQFYTDALLYPFG